MDPNLIISPLAADDYLFLTPSQLNTVLHKGKASQATSLIYNADQLNKIAHSCLIDTGLLQPLRCQISSRSACLRLSCHSASRPLQCFPQGCETLDRLIQNNQN
ncbi:hypothetical protein PGTUg99_029543 [Puccinia graminis f. sp. tritici]|uniref:Uncharacterized protein n=1 Tax=Puccinia graminis f. sp. tritici TaxID=56615 RepID=A0A5B0LWP1_PUCGR|nr:hypothetical protein PGTUg99_029543 [Puccinia graminis f. sp. tritici]